MKNENHETKIMTFVAKLTSGIRVEFLLRADGLLKHPLHRPRPNDEYS